MYDIYVIIVLARSAASAVAEHGFPKNQYQ